jgi:serine phosphatase RsbU (regulator of sigma subunit)
VTVAPRRSRSHLVPALLGTVLLAVALAWPAVAAPPPGKGPAAKKAPGQVRKSTAPVKAKKSAPSPGQAKKSSPPPGQARKSAVAGQAAPAKQSVAPGQAKKNSTAPGQAKKNPAAAPAPAAGAPASARRGAAGARARAAAASLRRAAARRRAAAAGRPTSAARQAPRKRPARIAPAAAAGAAAGAAAAESSGDDTGSRDSGRKERGGSPSSPLTQKEELPQPLRVARDIVEVVPTPLRILIAGLVALSILLALTSGLVLLRNRRLARQRRELLGQVGLLQAALLPELPDNVGPARASVAYRPADGPGAGGDFYDVFPLAAGKTAVLIGDVSGHGRAALGRTALARHTLRAYVEAGLEPRESLQIAGSVLTGKLQGDFVTALVAVYDAADGTLTYATAGHPPPIVVSGAGFEPVLAGTAPPLGVGAGTGQRQTTVPFPRGTLACFYTDGLTEARTPDGQLGAERLERLVRELGPAVTAKQVIDRVWSSAGRITDDAAVCILGAEEGTTIVRSRTERLEVTRAELRGSMLPEFLEACGVGLQRVGAAEREARAVARDYGGAVVEVRMGDRAQVDVRPPDLPLRDDATGSLHQPSTPGR